MSAKTAPAPSTDAQATILPPTAPAGPLAIREDVQTTLARAPVYDQMNARQIAVIKATVASGADDAELALFLELAAALDLNPFAHEIWCAKSKGRDGKPGRLMIMVGRDGLLKNARRQPGYAGYDADVLHADDTFQRVDPDPTGKTLRQRAGVIHTYGHPSTRGDVVGAWCAAELVGQPPRFFYASLAEYKPAGSDAYSPWGRQTSVMIDKVAISVVHRTLCNITGVHVEEELLAIGPPDEPIDIEVEFGDDQLGREIRWLVDAINDLAPNSYGPAQLQMELEGLGPENRVAFRDRLADELGRLAPEADAAPRPEAEAESLFAQLSTLIDQRAAHDGDPDDGDPVLADIDQEIAAVEERLRELGARIPGQASLDV